MQNAIDNYESPALTTELWARTIGNQPFGPAFKGKPSGLYFAPVRIGGKLFRQTGSGTTPRRTCRELSDLLPSNFPLVCGVGRHTLRGDGPGTAQAGLCSVSRQPNCAGVSG